MLFSFRRLRKVKKGNEADMANIYEYIFAFYFFEGA